MWIEKDVISFSLSFRISLSKHVKEKYNENGTNQEQQQGDKEETEEKLEKEEKEEEKEEKIEVRI